VSGSVPTVVDGQLLSFVLFRERPARRRAVGFTECRGQACTDHRSREITGSSKGFLRQSAKSDYRTFRQRSADDCALFGRDWTKQDAVMHVLQDQHEHLGQSIAYARTNGVVRPGPSSSPVTPF